MTKKQISVPISHQSIAMVGAILAAAASIVWGASKIDSRVASIEAWIVANQDTQIKLVQQEDHAKVLEGNQYKIMEHLDRLDKALARHK